MKAPNALINFLRYQEIVWKNFLHKFLPWCSSGHVWVHASSQLSYFMLLLDAWFSFCYFKVSKKWKLYLVVWWGIDNRKHCDRKIFSGNTQIWSGRKNIKSNLPFSKTKNKKQNKNKNYLKVLKVSLSFAYFPTNPFWISTFSYKSTPTINHDLAV